MAQVRETTAHAGPDELRYLILNVTIHHPNILSTSMYDNTFYIHFSCIKSSKSSVHSVLTTHLGRD